ncbi:MAG: prepilin-type N-terminal cleavage/methylation domain-containing protein [Planctomycetes bacterium]|nr:prepilin-type N-terminal cleavage/methylation domain-containing protein [Planctomycetota bacterium]
MRGFTLVEMMVSIALGMIIAFAAFAAFRVAARTIAVSKNLTRENRSLAEGYMHGMVEADFWYAEDDPFDPAGQPQRKIYDGSGAVVAASVIGDDNIYGQPFAELDLPDHYWNYNVSDNRTWWRGGLFKSISFEGFGVGSYAMVGCIDHADDESAWQHELQDRLYSNLGWAGFLDYLPNPMPIGYYLSPPIAGGYPNNSFGRPVQTYPFGQNLQAFSNKLWESMNHGVIWSSASQPAEKALSRSGVHLYGITTAFAPRPGWVLDGAPSAFLKVSRSAIIDGDMPTYNPGLASSPPHASLAALGWPDLQVKVVRSYDVLVSGRMNISVVVANPTTGKRIELVFKPIATTLRGARQQRQWTHWGSSVMDY